MISHVLEGLLPVGSHLPENAPSLANRLREIVGQSLAFDMKSLEAVDDFVLSQYKNKGLAAFREMLTPLFLEPLVAFVGEVLRRETGGQWWMVPCPEFGVWEPWIVNRVENYFAGYELAALCNQFRSPDPDSFSIFANVFIMLKAPRWLKCVADETGGMRPVAPKRVPLLNPIRDSERLLEAQESQGSQPGTLYFPFPKSTESERRKGT